MKRIDMVGKRFGRLVVLEDAEKIGVCRQSKCLCDCGKVTVVRNRSLTKGATRSCGCLRVYLIKKKASKNRAKHKREYGIWSDMKRRCRNPNNSGWDRYGGRGISVCDRWLNSFDSFIADMGPANGLQIDRINNDGDYEPGNCRWVTQLVNSRNRSNSRYLTFNGVTLTYKQWADKLGVSYDVIRTRRNAGWTTEKTVTTPLKGK